jgi:hypothetical protein
MKFNIPFSQIIHLTNVPLLDLGIGRLLNNVNLSNKRLLKYLKYTAFYEMAQEIFSQGIFTQEDLTQNYLDNLAINLDRKYEIVYTKEIYGFNSFFYLLTLGYYPIYLLKEIKWQFEQYIKFENSFIKNDLTFYFDILHAQGEGYLDDSIIVLVFQYYYHRLHDWCYPIDELDRNEINQSKKERFEKYLEYYNDIYENKSDLILYNLVSNFPKHYYHYLLILNIVKNIKTRGYLDFPEDQ